MSSSSSVLSRRSMLQLAGLAAAAPLGSLAASGTALAQSTTPKPLPLKIGVASYSLRKFPRDKAIAALKQLNVKYVTIKDVHLARTDSPEQIRTARKEFEDAGITIMGGGTLTWKTADEAAMRKDFEYAKAAGMPLVVCSPAPDTLQLFALNCICSSKGNPPSDRSIEVPEMFCSNKILARNANSTASSTRD